MNNTNQNPIADILDEIEQEVNAISLSTEEQAEQIVLTSQAYMDAVTEINNRYNDKLKELLADLKFMKEKSNQVERARSLTEVRLKIHK